LGLTQEQIAERAAMHTTYLGAIERGEKNVSVQRLVSIARALETTAGKLLTDVL
jgi:transcriptional regulator with XRE-family HTH domain